MSEAEDDRVATGATLSHFRIIGRLGEGGMGVVYRARDLELGRDVALKLLPAGVASQEARAALIEEARTASRLKHPNLCTIYEVGQASDQVFLAMELIEGRTLRDLIPKAGMPEETVVRYAAPLARALAHAHAQHVVHRDLKSSNIVVDGDGQAKLLDFGLSRRLLEELPGAESNSRTSTGVVVGTPESLAPELLQGGRANPASDVWAFGVVLYEMCAGHVPFTGTNIATVVTAILNATPAPLPERISPGFAQVVSRCLAKDPTQRYRSADEVAAALEALLPGATRSTAPTKPPRATGRSGIAVGAIALVLAAIAWALFLDTGGIRSRVFGPRTAFRSIAVLPLESLPPDPEQAYFADGMTEQLIGDLAQIRDLRVISRTSVQPFRGARKSLAEIARALDVDAVVEGSVQQDGGIVRIQLRLMNARTEQLLWAGSFDRPRRNVLALQSDVAREVTEHIRARLSPVQKSRLANSREVNPAAFEHYLKGRYALSHFQSSAAIGEFREAIRLDPDNPRAHAGLAHALVRTQVVGDSTVEAVLAQALAAASRAVELDPASADGVMALANVQATLQWNLPAAERSSLRAIELGPGIAEAHHTHGLVTFVLGRPAEGLKELERARELDPLNPYYHSQLAEALIFSRRYDDAISALTKMLALFPDDRVGRRDLGRAYLEKGDVGRAIAELRQLTPENSHLARAYAKANRMADARRLLAELEGRFARGGVTALDIAEVHASLGDRDDALEWLERSHTRREQLFLAVPFDPAFDDLRSEPRYAALARRSPWAVANRPAVPS